jgi:hypothetical protein
VLWQHATALEDEQIRLCKARRLSPVYVAYKDKTHIVKNINEAVVDYRKPWE